MSSSSRGGGAPPLPAPRHRLVLLSALPLAVRVRLAGRSARAKLEETKDDFRNLRVSYGPTTQARHGARLPPEARQPEDARPFANLLAFVGHTAVRARDARSARWADVDEARQIWTIPRHKTSDLTGAPHVVPLSSGALEVLTRIKEANLAAGHRGAEWLFPAPDVSSCEVCGEAGHSDKDSKAAARVKQASGVDRRGLLHRMRDTFKTGASEHGIDGRVSEAILANVPPGIVGTYDHAELLSQRREALEWWSGELARILTAKEPSDAEEGKQQLPFRRVTRRRSR